MTEDKFLRREAHEKEMWIKYPHLMTRLAPGDRECYGNARDYEIAKALYRRVVNGQLSPEAAIRELRSTKQSRPAKRAGET